MALQNISYWQPHKDEMPKSLYSFEVYFSLENGKCDYPEVKRWVEYHDDDIEDPEFVDL